MTVYIYTIAIKMKYNIVNLVHCMLRSKNLENLSIVIIRSHQLALCQLTNESQCTFTLIKRAADCG